jgi:ABC-type transport system involved in multi-copper enzyme maturation permease subunit
MKQVLRVALDLLFEAARRKWFIALFSAITLLLIVLGSFLQLDVIDGAISGSKFFGELLFDNITSTNKFMGALYQVAAMVSFYGGAIFMCLSCSDFAPELLAPGRIEHLLSLPISRWQLLAGTFLGVVSMAALGMLYGALGLTVIMGVKIGVWNASLLIGSAIGLVGFCTLYSLMLTVNFFVRSAALSGSLGIVLLILGTLASFRETIAVGITPGFGRELFSWAMLPFPRLGTLAQISSHVAGSIPLEAGVLPRLLGGCALFSLALLSVAAYRFENKDF